MPYRFYRVIIFTILLTGPCAFLLSLEPSQTVFAKTVEELQADLDAKRSSLKATEEKIAKFKQSIQEKKREAQTLAGQISLMDDNIQEIELNIEKTADQIAESAAEIESVEKDIEVKEQEIANQKILLADYIRSINDLDQQSTVAVFLKYKTFSEALSETSTILDLQKRAQDSLVTIQELHNQLLTKKRELSDFKQTLEALKVRQVAEQQTLESQRQAKQQILDITQSQESQYQDLLAQEQKTHQQAEAAIRALDQAIREELKKQGTTKLPSVGVFSWPINPVFGISCPFHCGGYPYANLIGPHSGMDIPTYVGTPIKAPADGYVAKLHDSGGPGYSYILLLHGDEISTVYGHVSGFGNVKEGQLVSRGTVIGYTGGASGSHGSGLSSGPHLHFEVRVNNIPVDPQRYL